MAEISTQKAYIWAHCEYCEDVHGACFSLTVTMTFTISWKSATVTCHGEADTQPLIDHMQKLHPDKVDETQQLIEAVGRLGSFFGGAK